MKTIQKWSQFARVFHSYLVTIQYDIKGHQFLSQTVQVELFTWCMAWFIFIEAMLPYIFAFWMNNVVTNNNVLKENVCNIKLRECCPRVSFNIRQHKYSLDSTINEAFVLWTAILHAVRTYIIYKLCRNNFIVFKIWPVLAVDLKNCIQLYVFAYWILISNLLITLFKDHLSFTLRTGYSDTHFTFEIQRWKIKEIFQFIVKLQVPISIETTGNYFYSNTISR